MLIHFITYLRMRFDKQHLRKLNQTERKIIRYSLVKSLCANAFREKYIKKILDDSNVKIYFLLMNPVIEHEYFDANNIIGCVAVRQVYCSVYEKRYVLPFISIRPGLRNCGYGSVIMNEIRSMFINRTNKCVTIYLHSLKKAINFYKLHGFVETNEDKYISKYDNLEEDDIIMKKIF